MSSQTCAYIAKKSDPESWHGSDPSDFCLNDSPQLGGFKITEWHCPHPLLERPSGNNDCAQYCIFHTDPEDLPDDVNESDALLSALEDAGSSPQSDRPEHRGQFVGATFGAIDLSGETITATDQHDIRFDHARFQTQDAHSNFKDATFMTEGQHPISFNQTKFRAAGEGDVLFRDARFETAGEGDVWFGHARFETAGEGNVSFWDARFETAGEGNVSFWDARFKTAGEGDVWFRDARFKTAGEGDVSFRHATLTNSKFRNADFGEAVFRDADFTGSDLRYADIEDISVNGGTTCEQLYEGYENDPSTGHSLIPTRLRRFYKESEFSDDDRAWDDTARAYHDLKTVFSKHGLIGKARKMHVRERRARSLEARAANGRSDRRYLRSLPSRVFTGYGVKYQNLVIWMVLLFMCSTAIYASAGVKNTLAQNLSFSVLAFTVAPPGVPEGVGTQIVMMFETFFRTLSIVLLGYILGNRERF